MNILSVLFSKNKQEEFIKKKRNESKGLVLNSLLKRGSLMLNRYDKIKYNEKNLTVSISYFDVPLINRTLYFDYEVDFVNKKLINKNFLTKDSYDLMDSELISISNKYFWYKNK